MVLGSWLHVFLRLLRRHHNPSSACTGTTAAAAAAAYFRWRSHGGDYSETRREGEIGRGRRRHRGGESFNDVFRHFCGPHHAGRTNPITYSTSQRTPLGSAAGSMSACTNRISSFPSVILSFFDFGYTSLLNANNTTESLGVTVGE